MTGVQTCALPIYEIHMTSRMPKDTRGLGHTMDKEPKATKFIASSQSPCCESIEQSINDCVHKFHDKGKAPMVEKLKETLHISHASYRGRNHGEVGSTSNKKNPTSRSHT